MNLIFELTFLILGIVVLARGRLRITKNRIVVGLPATVLGVILVGSLPGTFLAGFTFPLIERALFGAVPEPAVLYGFFEMFLNLCVLALVVVIGLATARPVRNVAEEEQTTNRCGGGHSGGRRQS